jgi:hypothetical protein
MTEPKPKRWSEPQPEVDPVLRSVARYAQRLEPDAATVQRLILATAGRKAPPRSLAMRRFSVGVALGLAAAFGGVAWANYGSRWFAAPERVVESAKPAAAPPTLAPRLREPALRSAAPLAVSPAPAPSALGAPPLPATPSVAAARPEASSAQDDSVLLQQARAGISADPSRALTLTRDHELRFPASPLVEEREALRIEAFARLGRGSEAARALEAFETRYPRSPYRRRLRSLVSP